MEFEIPPVGSRWTGSLDIHRVEGDFLDASSKGVWHVRVFTPKEVAKSTGSKYLGVLVASKYARELNSLPRDLKPLGEEEKLTTRAVDALISGQIEFRLVGRRRVGE